MKFSSKKLPELFEGIRIGKTVIGENYVLSGEKGDIAELTYLGNGEWRFYIDNFPGPKKFYQTNFPFNTPKEFLKEMKRIGLNLKLKK